MAGVQASGRATSAAHALLVVGVLCVIAGGLVAAVTDPLGLPRGSWVAAYLVLVGGVGQSAMAVARRLVAGAHGWVQFGAWNLGNALVLAGTMAARPGIVDLGGAGLVVAIALALVHSRALPSGMPLWAYRFVLTVMLVSIPVGLALAHLR